MQVENMSQVVYILERCSASESRGCKPVLGSLSREEAIGCCCSEF